MSKLDVRTIAGENLAKINPLSLSLPWLVVLVLVVIFVATKYSGNGDSTATQEEAVKIFPQIYVTDVEMRQFNRDGSAHYQMTTPLIRHFQIENQASDKDYTLFETPVFVLADDPKRPAWFVTAQEGRRDGTGEWFTLNKEVLARQTSQTQGEITISTDELHLNTQEQFAETSKAVTMRAAKSKMNALGMRADIKRDHIELLSNVKGTYEP